MCRVGQIPADILSICDGCLRDRWSIVFPSPEDDSLPVVETVERGLRPGCLCFRLIGIMYG